MSMFKPALFFACCGVFVVCWSGCGPQSIVLDHERAGQAGAGGTEQRTPAPETGGSSATSGGSASGDSAAGGTGGSADGGTSGSGTGATGGTLTANCDYVDALKSCNTLGCHAANYPAAGLNLIADANLVARLKDVPARHLDISCAPGDGSCSCDQNSFTCVSPPSGCPVPGSALLVNSADYTKSWILTKLERTDPMCGVQMPDGTYNTSDAKACIEWLVQAIAALP